MIRPSASAWGMESSSGEGCDSRRSRPRRRRMAVVIATAVAVLEVGPVATAYIRSGASTPTSPSPSRTVAPAARQTSRRKASTSGASPTTRQRW